MRVCVRSNYFCPSLISAGSRTTACDPELSVLLEKSSSFCPLQGLFQRFRKGPKWDEGRPKTQWRRLRDLPHTDSKDLALFVSLPLTFSPISPLQTTLTAFLSVSLFNLNIGLFRFHNWPQSAVAQQNWPCGVGGTHRQDSTGQLLFYESAAVWLVVKWSGPLAQWHKLPLLILLLSAWLSHTHILGINPPSDMLFIINLCCSAH